MKCIIIGAGIVGAAIADQLALCGTDVTILEQSAPASQASSKSFGWINANFAETPGYYRLRRAAIDCFRTLGLDLDLSEAIRWNGGLWWEDEGDALISHHEDMRAYGYPCEVIDAATVAALEPELAEPPEFCIRSELEGAANPVLVTRALLERAILNGATAISGCEVLDISPAKSGQTSVQTQHGQFEADHLIVAAGTESGTLLGKIGVGLPMDNKRGVIIETSPLEPLVDHVIMSPDVHFHQGVDGRLKIGEIFSGDVSGGIENIQDFGQQILNRVKARLPRAGEAAIETIMLGHRPVPVDGLPVIGAVPDHPGIYIATMHSGVTLAPLVGQLVAGEILTGGREELLSDFRHERFK